MSIQTSHHSSLIRAQWSFKVSGGRFTSVCGCRICAAHDLRHLVDIFIQNALHMHGIGVKNNVDEENARLFSVTANVRRLVANSKSTHILFLVLLSRVLCGAICKFVREGVSEAVKGYH